MSNVCEKFERELVLYFKLCLKIILKFGIFLGNLPHNIPHIRGALNFIVIGTYLIPMLYEIVLGTKVQRYGVNIPNFKMILRYTLNYKND